MLQAVNSIKKVWNGFYYFTRLPKFHKHILFWDCFSDIEIQKIIFKLFFIPRVEVVSSEILTKDAANSVSCAQKRQNIAPFEDTAVLRNASTKRKAESDNTGAAYDKRNSIRYSKSGNNKVEIQSEGQRYTNHERLDQCEISSKVSLERVNSQESRGSQTKHRRKIQTSQVNWIIWTLFFITRVLHKICK